MVIHVALPQRNTVTKHDVAIQADIAPSKNKKYTACVKAFSIDFFIIQMFFQSFEVLRCVERLNLKC